MAAPSERPDAPAPPAEPPRERPRRTLPSGFLVTLLALIGLVVAIGWVRDLLPDLGLDNPFGEQTIDRTSPAVLKSIRNLQDYRAASGHFEVIVDVERDSRLIPDEIKGERVLFVAVGSVDAGVDLGRLAAGAIEVTDDRRAVTIELPPARFREPVLDLERSRVYDRDRGLVDRIGQLFGDQSGTDTDLYARAEEQLAAAARSRSGLLARAESNTRATLESLLRSLGFERVEIRFAKV